MAASKNQTDPQPPSYADKFLEFFCKEEWIEPIKGDLYEQYLEDHNTNGKSRADLYYWIHIFNFLRPFAIKNKTQNLNSFIMYRSYFKFAWRNMVKHKFDTLINVTSLGIGLGCFIFIFLYIQGELSYDKFHSEADKIHRVVIDFVDSNGSRIPDATTHPALSPSLQTNMPEVAHTTRIFPTWGRAFLMGPDAENKFYEEKVYRVDSSFFDVFDFPLVMGDKSTALSDKNNIVISVTSAQKYFGAENPIGQSITIYGNEAQEFIVSAVCQDVPFNSHMDFDFLVPLSFSGIDNNWGWYNFYTYVKLDENASSLDFQSKLPKFYYDQRAAHGDTLNIIYAQLITDIHLKSDLKWELKGNGNINNVYMFSALAAFILFISFINYLNLTVASSFKRGKEVGVRKVFGAYRKSLMSQFTIETLVVVLISLALGTLICELMFRNMIGLLGRNITVFDYSLLPFYLILCSSTLLIGLIAGMYPAYHLSAFKISTVVRGIISKSGMGVKNFRKILLTVQFAISAFMLIGTLVVYQQLKYAQKSDLGFDKEQILIIPNSRAVQNKDVFKHKLLELSQVQNVGFSSGTMGGLNWTTNIGYPDQLLMNFALVDPAYIELMGYEFLKGGNFNEDRASHGEQFSLILNETAVKELNLDSQKIEESFVVRSEEDSLIYGKLIGVVKDFHFTNFKSKIKPFAFLMRDNGHQYITVKLKSTDISSTIHEIENIWKEIVPGIPMESYFQDHAFVKLYDSEEKLSAVLMFITGLAIFIAFIGMFAMTNLAIKDKIKELAIRKVLGASIKDLAGIIVRSFIFVIIIANVVAWPLGWFAMDRWLNGFAYRIELSIWFFALSILATLMVAGLTVGYQSLKAAKHNPVNSLSQE